MKYFLLLSDGMADLPVPELEGRTPMQVAKKPVMDLLASKGYAGLVQTVPTSLPAASDTANMSVMGFDPEVFYSGRAPIEALSMGLELKNKDIVFRVNLVTLSEAEDNYADKTMLDYSADEIPSPEAAELIAIVHEKFSGEDITFHPGRSYRHCMVWENGPLEGHFTPPHDILTQKITSYLPDPAKYPFIRKIMEESYKLLKDHPLNLARKEKGLKPANSIWVWGQGTKPALENLAEKYGLKSAVISGVDLIYGLGIAAGMKPVYIEGATGTIDTDFEGKAGAAIDEFKSGKDYVYLHVEAPDECGHRNEVENKVKSIEYIDQKILKPLYEYLEENRLESGEDYSIMVLPDHPTPLTLRTHTHDPVPFFIYDSDGKRHNPVEIFTEEACSKAGVFVEKGQDLFPFFIGVRDQH